MSFFHQTVLPGPKRLCLKLLFLFFCGVIEVLKQFPSIRDAGESQTAGVQETCKSFFECSLVFLNLQAIAEDFKATVNQKTV